MKENLKREVVLQWSWVVTVGEGSKRFWEVMTYQPKGFTCKALETSSGCF
jgi:hypothetical protein